MSEDVRWCVYRDEIGVCEESNVFTESIEKSMCNFFKVGVLRQVQGYIRGVVGYNSMIVGGYSSAVGLKRKRNWSKC